MTLSGPELEKLDRPLWFCLRTRTKQEALAAGSVRRAVQAPVFAPRVRFRKATRRGSVWFVEALFPGYVFACFHYAADHRHVRSQPGVASIVEFGDRVAVIEPAIIEQLRAAAGAEEEIVFDPEVTAGAAVRIAQGPFSGLETVVTRLAPSKERVCVLLEFLGRQVEAELLTQQVVSSVDVRGARL